MRFPLHRNGTGEAYRPNRGTTHLAWWRDPLTHFVVLGALLYVFTTIVASPDDDRRILVDGARVDRLAKLHEVQTGSAPTAEQRERLVQAWVREEALYREGRRLRLDDGDEMVRRRIVQKMEFLTADAASSAPTEEALHALFASGAVSTVAEPRVSFEHRFFSPDVRGMDGAREAADRALRRLREGAGEVASDRSPVPVRFVGSTRAERRLALGDRPVVDAVATIPQGVWSGPFASGFGWHLVRVGAREDGRPLTFDEARPALLQRWETDQAARAEAASMARLRARYVVVRDDRVGPGSDHSSAWREASR